jgi:hypothetical protein
METLLINKTVSASKQIVVDLPQLNQGDEIELIIMVKPFTGLTETKNKMFDMAQWADKWETDLGVDIRSSDVENFTGRSF